jgi:hypothetical protein
MLGEQASRLLAGETPALRVLYEATPLSWRAGAPIKARHRLA